MMNNVVGQRSVQDRWFVDFLAGDGGADNGEDAGTDDGANAQRGERPRAKRLLQAMLCFLRIRDQLVDGLAGKNLRSQDDAPGST